MEWNQLISAKRLGQETRHILRHDLRPEFRRDYDRLIFSAPFRRMQNKTQVFPLPGSIFVHNRLTHSLEVASVGRSLGDDVARQLALRHPELHGTKIEEAGTIVAAACLAHDMGNPPFGHSGEKAIQAFFQEGPGAYLREHVSPELWADVTHFEGNANAFRLLTHRFNGRREGGFAMTYSMLASIVKYPVSSAESGKDTHGKFGFFHSERDTFRRIADELGMPALPSAEHAIRYARHPLVYLVEAADDICYQIMDIEDAHKLRILTYEETEKLLLAFHEETVQQKIRQRIIDEQLHDRNEQVVYLRSCAIGRLEQACVQTFLEHEDDILSGSFRGALIDHTPSTVRQAYNECAALSVRRIYQSQPVLDVELSGYRIIETLMQSLVEAAVYPKKFRSQQIIRRFSSQYEIQAPDLETRLMAVIDYISGMTDVYALDVYQKINGTSLPIV